MQLNKVNLSIKKVLEKIEKKEILLPSIQRTFVWDVNKIQNFFDSIFSNYPIGLFLFWKINANARKKYNFYEFSKDVKKDYSHKKAKPTGRSTVSILDGQQRLTSLYCAFYGSHGYKILYKHDLERNYRSRKLYVNLFYVRRYDDEKSNQGEYEFKFKDPTTVTIDRKNLWFPMQELVDWSATGRQNAKRFIADATKDCKDTDPVSIKIKKNKDKYIHTLCYFYDVFTKKNVINADQVETPNIDTILDLFIRVNSGGLVLSRSDLLFSTITSKWPDVKEKVEKLKDTIFDQWKFNFSKDMIMRTCLMLTECKILFSVDKGFSKANLEKIKESWNDIAKAIFNGTIILKEWSISEKHLKSKNSIIPIFYYFFKGGKSDSNSKQNLKKYFLITNIKNHFSSHGDTMLSKIRNAMRDEKTKKLYDKNFNLEKIKKRNESYFTGTTGEKSFDVFEENIEKWLTDIQYPKTFFALYLLYDKMNFSDKEFHQDHIFPKSTFTKNKNNRDNIWSKANSLPNIMFLTGSINKEKSNMPFQDWLRSNYKNKNEKNRFINDNYIPKNLDLSFSEKNFEDFWKARKELMAKELKKRFC